MEQTAQPGQAANHFTMAIKKIFNFQFSIFKKNSWLENKTKLVRKFGIPRAARATRPAREHLVVFLAVAFSASTLVSTILPKNQIQTLKEKLVRNPDDFEANLDLAQNFLANNQLKEAEQSLRLAQKIPQNNPAVLGQQTSQKLEELWQQKQYSDPQDVRRLIAAWEKIVEEKPDYRDGWLQLTVLYYKLYQNDQAKAALQKALYIDPNYAPAKELAKIIF